MLHHNKLPLSAEISSWPKTLETNYATKKQFLRDLQHLRSEIDVQKLRAEEAFKAYHIMIKIIYEGVIQSLQGGSFSLVWNTLVGELLTAYSVLRFHYNLTGIYYR